MSELLRSADKSIKDGNLDLALAAISRVFEFDPRNVYARAYQERILSLKESQIAAKAHAEKLAAENAKAVMELESAKAQAVESESAAPQEPQPAETESTEPQSQELPQMREPEPATDAAPVTDAVPATNAEQDESAPYDSVSETLTHEAPPPSPVDTAAAQTPVTLEVPLQPPFDFMKHTPALLQAYKTLLSEVWENGVITDEDRERVRAMRDSFAITNEEHLSIEREVRFDAYVNAIEHAWKKGITNFDDLRRQFRISDQEHLQIEGRVFRLLQSLRSVGTVLLVDDDTEFLELAGRQLTDAGLYCVAVPTCEDALKTLESLTPDIVVCDVNFSKPNISGFAFYEKFRAMEKFFHCPFLFLSGMAQEAVQRTGMQMGADGYFLKPVDLELFLATIEGKIKRSHEVQLRLAPHRL